MPAKPPRPLRIEGSVAYVPLTQGYEAVVDAADAPIVAPHLWRVQKQGRLRYASTYIRQDDGKLRTVEMHHMLLRPEPPLITDHADGDGLNNRRSNLRYATRGQNKYNSRRYRNNQSGVKGVHPTRHGTWTVQIRHEKRKHYIGTFKTLEAARYAYAEAAKRLHGEFARFD